MNDILIVKDGATTGKVALIRDLPFKKVAVNEHVFIVRSKNEDILDNHYLFYLLFSSHCQNQIKKRFHGVVGGINRTDFKTIQVPLPPISEQREIVELLSVVDARITITQQISDEITRLKRGLVQLLMTGKFRKNRQ